MTSCPGHTTRELCKLVRRKIQKNVITIRKLAKMETTSAPKTTSYLASIVA